ncbi:hypothetical protein J5N97_000607 [Dioscorea zingiberensis]|uniref:CRAL-TRIO domain-containing protein n=1 Tax=Dioscorea zingiberensis TaxID=325984 RepID=A0A9D5BVD5_9LILI|nr:hypothetical protein J5N97_000607 [Dioscorea zingiberensis]
MRRIMLRRKQAKIKELKAAIGPLSGRSSQFLLLMHAIEDTSARSWNVDKAHKMLEETLKWRSTYKPEEIFTLVLPSRAKQGRPIEQNFNDREGRTNTSSHGNQLRHLVYLLENAILNLPEDQEQMIWLIDFSGWSLSNSVPVKTARDHKHFAESLSGRLGAAFLYNPPNLETFWKIVKYFLDPKTFQKVKFVYPKNEESMELMHKHFDIEMLPVEFGGKNKIEYDHEEFSKIMMEDDIKSARVWGSDEKFILPNQANNAEVVSESSHDAAQAS